MGDKVGTSFSSLVDFLIEQPSQYLTYNSSGDWSSIKSTNWPTTLNFRKYVNFWLVETSSFGGKRALRNIEQFRITS